MRRKPGNKRKIKKEIFCTGLLCCLLTGSVCTYGFDISEDAESYDTGGFDMDIGEGSGQFPESWEDDPAPAEQEPVSAETEEYPAREPEEDNSWQNGSSWENNSASKKREETSGAGEWNEWNTPAAENEGPVSGSTEPEKKSALMPRTIKETSTLEPSAIPIISPTPAPAKTQAASPTEKPKKMKKTKAPSKDPSPKKNGTLKKQQKLALSYYQTGNDSDKTGDLQKEKIPSFQTKLRKNEVEINSSSKEEPFQVLSFRINGKECGFRWKGKKLLAEIPKEAQKLQTAELLGFVKSGRLCHEIVDLTEKQ